jgi:hypothetical protein
LRLFLSGGSPIPEVTMDKPDIMLSYFVDVGKRGLPNARMRAIMRIRTCSRWLKVLETKVKKGRI